MKNTKKVYKRTTYIHIFEAVWLLMLIISFVICIGFMIPKSYVNRQDKVYNKARILLNDEIRKLQNNTDNSEISHQYVAFDLTGIVTSTNTDIYSRGEHINVTEELQTDYSYIYHNQNKIKVSFPLYKEDSVSGFAVFFIDCNDVINNGLIYKLTNYSPIIVWGSISLISLMLYLMYIRRKIYSPIQKIAESSQAIISGDYSHQIVQRSKNEKPVNEIEQLMYSFEMMRDELKDKCAREEQLKKSQKELLSCMSHDLRTPIATIQAHAEAIRDGIIKSDEKKEEYINTIIRKTKIVNSMIAELLDHSNAEANKLSIQIKEQYTKDYFDLLAEELKIYCSSNGCSFEYENNCGNILLRMDKERIMQVIYNLVENACKYMRLRKPTQDDEAPMVRFKCERKSDERRIYISVSDNGPGIEIMDIPYVFDRFYRAEKSRSTQIPGAGLGLSICKYIVEQHNGEISIKSHKDKGSIVMFYIPY